MNLENLIQEIKKFNINLNASDTSKLSNKELELRYWALSHWFDHAIYHLPLYILVDVLPSQYASRYPKITFDVNKHASELEYISSISNLELLMLQLWEEVVVPFSQSTKTLPLHFLDYLTDAHNLILQYAFKTYGLKLKNVLPFINDSRHQHVIQKIKTAEEAYEFLCSTDEFREELWKLGLFDVLLKSLNKTVQDSKPLALIIDARGMGITNDKIFLNLLTYYKIFNKFYIANINHNPASASALKLTDAASFLQQIESETKLL